MALDGYGERMLHTLLVIVVIIVIVAIALAVLRR